MGLFSSFCETVVVGHGIGAERNIVSKRIPIVVSTHSGSWFSHQVVYLNGVCDVCVDNFFDRHI